MNASSSGSGAPGPRTHTPDGNSVEAVCGDLEEAVPVGHVDYLRIREKG